MFFCIYRIGNSTNILNDLAVTLKTFASPCNSKSSFSPYKSSISKFQIEFKIDPNAV